MGVLAQETLLHNELHIRLLNLQIGITVGDMAEHISGKLEFWCLVYQFLHAKYHAEFCTVRHMTKSLQHLQVTA